MAWLKLEDSYCDHWKFNLLARRLSIPKPMARGLMSTLWSRALRQAPDGDLSHLGVDGIEDAADWSGESGAFFSAATDPAIRLIEVEGDSIWLHDWSAGSLKRAEAKRNERARKKAEKEAAAAAEAARATPEIAGTDRVTTGSRRGVPAGTDSRPMVERPGQQSPRDVSVVGTTGRENQVARAPSSPKIQLPDVSDGRENGPDASVEVPAAPSETDSRASSEARNPLKTGLENIHRTPVASAGTDRVPTVETQSQKVVQESEREIENIHTHIARARESTPTPTASPVAVDFPETAARGKAESTATAKAMEKTSAPELKPEAQLSAKDIEQICSQAPYSWSFPGGRQAQARIAALCPVSGEELRQAIAATEGADRPGYAYLASVLEGMRRPRDVGNDKPLTLEQAREQRQRSQKHGGKHQSDGRRGPQRAPHRDVRIGHHPGSTQEEHLEDIAKYGSNWDGESAVIDMAAIG